MKKWYGIVVLFALLAVFFLLKDLNFYEIREYLLQMNLWYFALAFICCFGAFFFWGLRFKFLCKDLIKINLFYILKIIFAGSFMNAVTPGIRVGGEPVKAYLLSKRYHKPKSKFFACIFADKFFHLFSFAIFLIFSILFILVYITISSNLKFILEVLLISILFISGLFFFLIFKRINFNWMAIVGKFYRLKFIKKNFKKKSLFEKYVKKKAREFGIVFKSLIKNKRTFFLATLLSIIYWILFYFISYFLFLAFDFRANFLSIVIVVTLGFLVAEFSLTPGGIGITEGSMILLYRIMGINLALAIIVTLISRLIYYFYNLVIGGISLVHFGVDSKRNKIRESL